MQMIDLVFPNHNEKEFVQVAHQLSVKNLCFAYPLKEFNRIKTVRSEDVNVFYGVVLKPNELRKVKKPVDLVIVKNSNKNRKALENKRADLLFDLENHSRRDFIHHRNSGLNQVLGNLASKKRKIIGFSFNSILKSEPGQRSRILGRMMQNVRLCRKYQVSMAVASFATAPYEMRSLNDLKAFARVIGMQEGEPKKALNILYGRIKSNQDKRSPGYIRKGLRRVK